MNYRYGSFQIAGGLIQAQSSRARIIRTSRKVAPNFWEDEIMLSVCINIRVIQALDKFSTRFGTWILCA